MTIEPMQAGEVARQLWQQTQQAHREAAPSPDGQATAERLLATIDVGLRRWIGAEGYAALLSRATAIAMTSHGALGSLNDLAPFPPPASTATSQARFTDAEWAAAMVGLLEVMMELLGGIIGTDMAIRLMALSGTPSTRGLAGPETNDT